MASWCGTGPKSYAYETNNGKRTCKVKGFTLNHKNAKRINLETIKEVISGEREKIVIENNLIKRNARKEVVNETQEKEFKPCYDKRKIFYSFGKTDTVPWGF